MTTIKWRTMQLCRNYLTMVRYGSMVGILRLLCLCFTVTYFSEVEKDSGVKLCMLVRLLSEMSFSHFGELWPRGSSSRSLNMRMRAPYDGICVLLMHLFCTFVKLLPLVYENSLP